MVLLIIIPFLNGYFIGNINPTFSDKPIYSIIFEYYSGIWSIMATFSGDVQYTQNGTGLPTPAKMVTQNSEASK